MNAPKPFTDTLARLATQVTELWGIELCWKDADLGLRLAQPRQLVEHRHPRCLATKGKGHAERERCIRHCRIDAADWNRRRPPAQLSTCHAGCREYRLPVRAGGQLLGTLCLGPVAPAGDRPRADLPPEPDRFATIAALLADHIAHFAEERDRELGRLRDNVRHPALQRLALHLASEVRHDERAEDLAERCGLSVSRLQHLCRAELDGTLGELRDRALLRRARLGLRRKHASIGRLADELGFRDQRYFATWFRRLTGQTPSAWRRLEDRDA